MTPIKRIMVAYDFSFYAKEALAYAAALAKDTNADLVVVNVINDDSLTLIAGSHQKNLLLDVSKYLKCRDEYNLKRINEYIKELGISDLQVSILVKVGKPFQKLIETVHDAKIDLVVMGQKGRTDLSSILFGTTAERMFRHCPVTLVSLRSAETMRTVKKIRRKESAA